MAKCDEILPGLISHSVQLNLWRLALRYRFELSWKMKAGEGRTMGRRSGHNEEF